MVVIKTEAGQTAFKERSSLFTQRQRSAFILVDGKKTVQQLLTAAEGIGVTQADLDAMIVHGLLRVVSDIPEPSVALPEAGPARTDEERYLVAKPLAVQLTAGMGLRGLLLNLSVESAANAQELIALLPQLEKALGRPATRDLERALRR